MHILSLFLLFLIATAYCDKVGLIDVSHVLQKKLNRGVDVLGTKSTPLAVEINLPPYFLVQYS